MLPGRGRPGRRLRGRTGRDAVVDDDHGLACQRYPGPLPPITALSALQLRPLERLHFGKLVLRHTSASGDFIVHDAHAALADRTHAQLSLEGHAELAHHENVERSAERLRNLVGDGYASAGQAEHNDPIGAAPMLQ